QRGREAAEELTDMQRRRMRHIEVRALVNAALNSRRPLQAQLQACAEALVQCLGGAFARIWTLDERDDALELRASAGLHTRLDGPYKRVPVGSLQIGRIAAGRSPYLTNDALHDERMGEEEE